MRKKRKTDPRKKYRTQRDVPNITKRRSLLSSPFIIRKQPSPKFKPFRPHRRIQPTYRIIEDRRRFRPIQDDLPRMVDGRRVSYVLEKRSGGRISRGTRHRIQFHRPRRVVICVRRKNRRVSLFAKGRIGKGRSVSTRRRRNEYTDIKC